MNKKFLLILTILGLTACTKNISLDEFAQPEPKLVVNALIQADSSWKVQLTQLKPITGPLVFEQVSNPIIEISREGETVCLLDQLQQQISPIDQYTHQGNCELPQPGEVYTLKVDAPTFPSVTSTDTIPLAAQVESHEFNLIDLQEITSRNFPSRYSLNGILKLTLLDDPIEAGFYQFFATAPADYISTFGDVIDTMYAHTVRIELLNAELSSNIDIYSDSTFNGLQKELTFELSGLIRNRTAPEYVQIEIRKVSRQYHSYQTGFFQHATTNQDPFASPIGAYSNIKGGLGIWAGYHSTYLEIEL